MSSKTKQAAGNSKNSSKKTEENKEENPISNEELLDPVKLNAIPFEILPNKGGPSLH